MKLTRTLAVAAALSLSASVVSAQETTAITVTTAADGTVLYGGLTLPAAAVAAGLPVATFLAAVSNSSSSSST